MEEIHVQEIAVPADILDKWQSVVDIMADILTVPSAIVTRVDPPEIEVLRSAHTSENPYKAGDKAAMAKHYCEAVVTKNSKLQVSHAPTDPDWNNAPEIEYGMLAYLGYPLCWPGGHLFGTICILDNKSNRFGERYEKVLLKFKELIEAHLSLVEMNDRLTKALAEVETLRGLLPICCVCKKIRDDKGYWNQIETYIHKCTGAEFSHGICPDCAKEHYPDYWDEHD